MNGDSYYLRSPQEMATLFAEVPQSISNTVVIAERCSVNLERDEYHLTKFNVPEGYDSGTYLRKLCEEGVQKRYKEHADDACRERLNYD